MTQQQALAILKTGANVFLTGEPGSGKSHTVNEYVKWLKERGVEPSVTASTGIAATHIGGMTIHSWAGIGIKRMLTPRDLSAIAGKRRVASRMREASVLIIDEVSMLSADTLSMVDQVCRTIRNNTFPFGGLQIVLVGDFFQLPPIVQRDFSEPQASLGFGSRSPFAFNSPSWDDLRLQVCYLSEQHRQEDAAFLEVLSAMRRGVLQTSHRELLHTRRHTQRGGAMTQLFAHNIDVDRINDDELSKLPGAVYEFSMTDMGPDELVVGLKKGCLSPAILQLKINARVMFTKNDPSQRFVNGTLGTVVGFGKETGVPMVKLANGRSVLVEPVAWSIEDGAGGVLAYITQIPLRLAWAMTVHKSQGMSLDAAHMDLSRVFEYGQGYVALSRVRTLAGLSLAGINERALEVHPEIRLKDDQFRRASEVAEAMLGRWTEQERASREQEFLLRVGGRNKKTIGEKVKSFVDSVVGKKEKSYDVETLRENHGNAYRAWDEEQEADLLRRVALGESVNHIAESMGRKPGAIRSRLKKIAERN